MSLKQNLPNSLVMEVSYLNSLSSRFVLNPSRDLWKIKVTLSIPGKNTFIDPISSIFPIHLPTGKLSDANGSGKRM